MELRWNILSLGGKGVNKLCSLIFLGYSADFWSFALFHVNFRFPLFWSKRVEELYFYLPAASSVFESRICIISSWEKNTPSNQVTGMAEGAGLADGLCTAPPSWPGKLTLKLPCYKHHVSLGCFWCANTKGMVTKHSVRLSRLRSCFSCCSCRCFSSHLSFSNLLISVIPSLPS